MNKNLVFALFAITLIAAMTVTSVEAWLPPSIDTSVYYPRLPFFPPQLIRSQRMNLKLVEKNPVTWQPVPNGAWGYLVGTHNTRLDFFGYGLKPFTSYTLIYYGYGANNDVWPWATCIMSKKTWSNTDIIMKGTFNYANFLNDGIPQKFWLIESDDINCATHKMTSWSPTEYLFEWNTV